MRIPRLLRVAIFVSNVEDTLRANSFRLSGNGTPKYQSVFDMSAKSPMATAAPDDTENKQWFPFDRAGVLPGTTVSKTSLKSRVGGWKRKLLRWENCKSNFQRSRGRGTNTDKLPKENYFIREMHPTPKLLVSGNHILVGCTLVL